MELLYQNADQENSLNQLIGAAFGAVGQQCMVLSAEILIGDYKKWVPELMELAKNMRVNAEQPGSYFGPLISPQVKEPNCNMIDSGMKEGVSISLDA